MYCIGGGTWGLWDGCTRVHIMTKLGLAWSGCTTQKAKQNAGMVSHGRVHETSMRATHSRYFSMHSQHFITHLEKHFLVFVCTLGCKNDHSLSITFNVLMCFLTARLWPNCRQHTYGNFKLKSSINKLSMNNKILSLSFFYL